MDIRGEFVGQILNGAKILSIKAPHTATMDDFFAIRIRRATALISILIAAVVLPSVVWCLGDKSVWAWDQSLYANSSLRTWTAHRAGVWHWLHTMMHAGGASAPLIIWLSQFSLPLRHLTGQFESALLLFNVAAYVIILFLINAITRDLGCALSQRMAAILACGGAGIVIALCHQFLAETVLCAASTFAIYCCVQTHLRAVIRCLALLIISISVGLLAKSLSVIFLIPLTAYAAVSLFLSRDRVRQSPTKLDGALLICGCVVALATVVWYATNWVYVAEHFKSATIGDVALHYGSPVDLGRKIAYWSQSLGLSISSFVWIPAALALLIVSALLLEVIRTCRGGLYHSIQKAWEDNILLAITLAGSVIATIFIFSLQINEDTRFLIIAIPMVAVLVGWSLKVVHLRSLSVAFVLLLAFNAGINQLQSQGLKPLQISPYGYLYPPDFSGSDRTSLEEAIRITCREDMGNRWNLIAVDYKNLNTNSAAFYSAKMTFNVDWTCRYTNLGFAPTDLNAGLSRITTVAPPFVLTVDPQRQPPSDFVNRLSKPVAEWLSHNPEFALAAVLKNGIVIYREQRHLYKKM
jgi:hypothetical protein